MCNCNQWQPIDECNHGYEGNNFLLWWPYVTKEKPIIGYFGITDSGQEKWMGNEVLGFENDPGPTHWMPLPKIPPDTAGSEGQRG